MILPSFPTLLILLISILPALAILKAASVEEAFPALRDLENDPGYHPIGGQSFTFCCLKAVKEFYDDPTRGPDAGTVIFSLNPNHILITRADPAQFQSEQWPCGASYNGSEVGAPEVSVPYRWCAANCGGWQRSRSAVLSQWVQPFVGFILPAAVFCLNVPRKRVLAIKTLTWFPNHLEDLRKRWDVVARQIFGFWRSKRPEGEKATAPPSSTGGTTEPPADKAGPAVIENPTGPKEQPISNGNATVKLFDVITSVISVFLFGVFVLVEMVVRGALASAIALTDTVIWIAIVFSTAAPMMLSGLYEANVDRQIVEAVQASRRYHSQRGTGQPVAGAPMAEVENNLHLLKREVHLLYAVLVGNLAIPDHPRGIDVGESENKNGKEAALVQDSDPEAEPANSQAWNDIQALVTRLDGGEGIDSREAWVREREATRSRLQTMLDCQVSFGASIGAPVVFYLGSFLLSVFSNLLTLGDNDTAHALAFGEWWMTVPHVAVVSGCLLAGNNPNTLEAIMSGLTARHRSHEPATNPTVKPDSPVAVGPAPVTKKGTMPPWLTRAEKLWFKYLYNPYYEKSDYQPVWMFERGRNKGRWITSVQQLYLKKKKEEPRNALQAIKIKYTRWWSRIKWRYGTDTDPDELSLPNVLPDTDLMDWLSLVVSVIVLMFIPFILAYLTSFYTPVVGLGCRSFTFLLYSLFQFWLGALWLWDFQYDKHLPFLFFPEWRGRTYALPTRFGLATGFGFVGSAFTAIAGTFMQILGVYRNCLCMVPLNRWSSPGDVYVTVSTNSADSIYFAKLLWLSNGIASIVLLIVVCYFGWWYQRHWRARFSDAVTAILKADLPDRVNSEVES